MTRTVRAAIIVGFDQLVAELGGDPAAVWKASGMESIQLVDSDTLISAQLATTVLNLSAQETHCDHFGLELAKRRNLDTYSRHAFDSGWRTFWYTSLVNNPNLDRISDTPEFVNLFGEVKTDVAGQLAQYKRDVSPETECAERFQR